MADNDNKIELSDPIFNGKQVAAIVNSTVVSTAVEQYKINEAYYKGKNVKIIADGIENDRDGQVPNNIVPVPIARKSVNDLVGYAYKPGNVTFEFDEKQDETSKTEIKEIFKENDEPLESSEIFSDACIKGEGAELVWFTDKEFQFAKVKRENVIFSYNDTLKKDTLEYAIRYYDTSEVNSKGKEVITHHADVYDFEYVNYYEHTDKSAQIVGHKSRIQVEEYTYTGSIKHNLGKVPLHPYNINEDLMGVYEASLSIINQLDQLGSDSIANAIAQFNDTFLAMSKTIDDETADKANKLKIFDNLGGKDEGNFVEFLQRNMDISGTLESTKLFQDWYYEFTGIPNLGNEKFNVKSGIAMAFALISFENLVASMQIYFTKGLLYRLDLINNGKKFLNSSYVPVEATLKWERNLPFDLETTVKIIKELKEAGIVSDETLLDQLPDNIVSDSAAEIKKKLDEDTEKMKRVIENTVVPEEPEEDETDEGNQE